MYRYVSSWVKPFKSSEPYTDKNLANTKISEILDTYIEGYFEVSHTALKAPVYFNLNYLRSPTVPLNIDLTMANWLTSLRNTRLPTFNKKPTYTTSKVYARDIFLSGYKVSPCEPNKNWDSNASIGSKTNLYLKVTPQVKMGVQTRCLTTVNGMLHRNYPFEHGLQIVDGGKSSFVANSHNCSLISFEEVGQIVQIPITDENLSKVSPAIPYKHSFVLNLGMNLTDKTFVISLGGYGYFNPSWIKVIDEERGLVLVEINHLDISHLLRHSRKLIDLSSLGIVEMDGKHEDDFGKLRLEEVNSDVVVKKWLTLVQSFIVVVSTPNLSVDYLPTHTTGLLNTYEYHENPIYPLTDHYGRLPEYWVKRQHDAWIVQVRDGIYKNPLYKTGDANTLQFTNDIIPYHAEHTRNMYFLKIQSTVRQR